MNYILQDDTPPSYCTASIIGERERANLVVQLARFFYRAEREESTFSIFSLFSSYLCHTISYGQRQYMTVILNIY